MSVSIVDEIRQINDELSDCSKVKCDNFEKIKLLINLQSKSLKLIEDEGIPAGVKEESIYNIIHLQMMLLSVPDHENIEDADSYDINYEDYIELSDHCLRNLIQLLRKEDANETYKNFTVDHLKKVSLLTLNIFATHHETQPWSNHNLNQLCSDLLEEVLRLCRCSNVRELLEGSDNSRFEFGLAKDLLIFILPNWKGDSWKRNPANKQIFQWILFNINRPNLFEYVPQVLSPSLVIADDYNLQNKILGVRCLNHIITNVTRSELRMYGRAEVIFDALFHLLYTHEAELMPHLIPCLLGILTVVDENPNRVIPDIKRNKCDKVFSLILENMNFEQKVALRRAYSAHLAGFISYMKIRVVRHMKSLLQILYEYLEVRDSPEQLTRKYSLLALKELINVARPRIPTYIEPILKNLLKFVYDIDTEEDKTTNAVKEELQHLVVECLILLRNATSDEFEKLCTQVKEANINSINKILELL